MAQTEQGAKKAVQTHYDKYGADYYRNIGKLGGSAERKTPRYWEINPDAARESGRKGGKVKRNV